MQHLDVAIVGAGLSGIGAAAQLRRDHPELTVAIFEARSTLGGTWDLFRYPGVRSDSDMFTFSYWFRPWSDERVIAPGEAILDYLHDTARDEGVDGLIRYEHRVTAASWSSVDQRWTLDVVAGTETSQLTCAFLFIATGYYRYDEGYSPHWPGEQQFTGQIVHPQLWPSDLDCAGKRMVVIGSGATAVTLVPALADVASAVTMVQRSPSYIASIPSVSRRFTRLSRVLPKRAVYGVMRAQNIVSGVGIYQFAQRAPGLMKRYLRRGAVRQLPEGFAVDTHFTPSYGPWDQRLCAAPDGDFFRAISSGRASVVTGTIDRFDADGLVMASGDRIDADIVVTATGLNLLVFGGIGLSVDGSTVDLSSTVAYKGMMLSDVPNLAFGIGYTNATWALKINLVIRWVSDLIATMRSRGLAVATPRVPASVVADAPFIEMSSGYIQRSVSTLPRQGSRMPWRLHQNYLTDRRQFRSRRYTDLEFAPRVTD